MCWINQTPHGYLEAAKGIDREARKSLFLLLLFIRFVGKNRFGSALGPTPAGKHFSAVRAAGAGSAHLLRVGGGLGKGPRL